MEVVLVARTAPQVTADLRLAIQLGDPATRDQNVTQLSQSEWPGAASPSEHNAYQPVDWSNRVHTLSGYSSFGSAQTNEFATWTQGRNVFLDDAELLDQKLKDKCEDDLRSFAERSDRTEGFMVTTPVADAFGGLTCALLEVLRDEFGKSTIFTTATLSDSLGWKRSDTQRSRAQRLLNTAMSMQHLEELSSMLLPLSPPRTWSNETPWATYLRDDMSKPDSCSQVLTMHLQSANTELRETDGLTTVVNKLNWRGDNKIAHLTGAVPLLPPHMLKGPAGLETLKATCHDFSVFVEDDEDEGGHDPDGRREKRAKRVKIDEPAPFAQYSIVRGYDGDELQELGAILESSTPLKEPLATWIALPDPFPVLPTLPPIFRSLHPTGQPLLLDLPPHPEPLSKAGLFGLPDPRVPKNLALSFTQQPSHVPVLTQLATTPAARHLLRHLAGGVQELVRGRASVLREYEDGEGGVGREGTAECRERLAALADGLAAAGGFGLDGDEEDLSDGEEGAGDPAGDDWELDV